MIKKKKQRKKMKKRVSKPIPIIEYPQMSDEELKAVIAQFHRGVPFDRIKYAYADYVINNNEGNLTASAREMKICYRTLVYWMVKKKTTAISRGKNWRQKIRLAKLAAK